MLFQFHGSSLPALTLWSTQQSREQDKQGLLQGQHKDWKRIDTGPDKVSQSALYLVILL